jgi:hypothetical protein
MPGLRSPFNYEWSFRDWFLAAISVTILFAYFFVTSPDVPLGIAVVSAVPVVGSWVYIVFLWRKNRRQQ